MEKDKYKGTLNIRDLQYYKWDYIIDSVVPMQLCRESVCKTV